jgi:hypothetical protein
MHEKHDEKPHEPEEWTPQEQPTGSSDPAAEDEDDKPSSRATGRAIGGGTLRGAG